jgi:aminoglycoside phosphotransferase (APT) family kinase protein
MQQPWHNDVSFSISDIRAIVARHTGLDDAAIQKLDEGWDTEIYLVNDELIFRFAKREFVIPFINTEIQALPVLGAYLNCPIPVIRHSGLFKTTYPYLSYPKLPGTIAADLALSDTEKLALIIPVTDFLNQLHGIPLTDEVRAVIPPDTIGRLDIAKRTDQIKSRVCFAAELGFSFSDHWLQDLISKISQKDMEKTNCLVHGDLYARNILIQDRRSLSGIIDWTDIHIGHPAKDLSFAVSFFNPDALRKVIERYQGFQPAFFYLATLSALNLTCRLTEYALDIRNELLIEECKTSFTNIQNNYLAYAKSW